MSDERSAISSARAGAGQGAQNTFLQSLYARYWPEICHYLRGRFGAGPPEPQDIAQQAFAQLAALSNPQSITNPRAFLYRTAINAAIDHRRNQRRRERLLDTVVRPEAEEDIHDPGPERVLLGQEQLSILEEAVMALPERDRTFFLLNRYEGVSFAEIARQTGMSPSGVRLIVEQALASCQVALRAAERKGARRERRDDD
jgi:RNA polymerase sigma factor (sigma-70 family)